MRKKPVLTNDEDLEQLTSLFRLLSDKTRLNILTLLSSGDRNVSSLCKDLNLPQPTVSHHLGLLRMNNLIANRRDGKQVFYGLSHRDGIDASSIMQLPVQRYDVRIVPRKDNGLPAASKRKR